MTSGFEIELVDSSNRPRSRWQESPMSALNLAIVTLGFVSIAVAYTLNSLPAETLVDASKAAIDAATGAQSSLPALARFVVG